MRAISKGVTRHLHGFRMVSCEKIKRDRASIASPAPFEIPARSLSRRTRRTAFSGFGSDITPALRSEINLPSANSVFCTSHSSLFEVLSALWIVIYSSSNNIITCIVQCNILPSIFLFQKN